jgi:hypothetical protein
MKHLQGKPPPKALLGLAVAGYHLTAHLGQVKISKDSTCSSDTEC